MVDIVGQLPLRVSVIETTAIFSKCLPAALKTNFYGKLYDGRFKVYDHLGNTGMARMRK